MKHLFLFAVTALLVGCGADGEPIQPSMAANIGLGSGGLSGTTGVTLQQGPVSVGLGLGL